MKTVDVEVCGLSRETDTGSEKHIAAVVFYFIFVCVLVSAVAIHLHLSVGEVVVALIRYS